MINPNERISGFVLIGLKGIRQVNNIEILNYLSENRFDDDVFFYLSLMGGLKDEEDLDFKKVDRIRKIAPAFLKYHITYTTQANPRRTIEEYNLTQPDDKRNYDYILLWESENLIEEYKNFCLDFRSMDEKKFNFPGYCRRKKVQSHLQDYEPYGEILVDDLWRKA
ncbi:MAG: hypothetical protein AAF518_06020 [Spirochaetota bacterium]